MVLSWRLSWLPQSCETVRASAALAGQAISCIGADDYTGWISCSIARAKAMALHRSRVRGTKQAYADESDAYLWWYTSHLALTKILGGCICKAGKKVKKAGDEGNIDHTSHNPEPY